MKKNQQMTDKLKAINEETNRRKNQKKFYDDKYLELSGDQSYLTSYVPAVNKDTVKKRQDSQNNSNKSNMYIEKLINIAIMIKNI